MASRETLSIRMDLPLKKAAEEAAKQANLPISAFVRNALKSKIEKQQDEDSLRRLSLRLDGLESKIDQLLKQSDRN